MEKQRLFQKRLAPADAKRGAVEEFSDRSLNYYSDQMPDIKPRLRRLNWKWGLQKVPSSALLLGGAVGLLLRRRYAGASLLLGGFLLRQVLNGTAVARPAREAGRDEIELERYALKAQRGDFGKLEVIAFK